MAESGNAYAWNFDPVSVWLFEPPGFKINFKKVYGNPSPGVYIQCDGAIMDQKDQKKQQDHRPKEKQETSIIRMAGRDINGNYDVRRGLMQIKGIGQNMARAIAKGYARIYKVDEATTLGSLTDEQVAQLEGLIKEPQKAGVPAFMLNRRKDLETGMDMHVAGTDLIVKTRQDIEMGIKMQTWVGSRHQYGQRARGQRTRNTGRTGTTVGVMKKSVQQQVAPAAGAGGKTPKEGKAPKEEKGTAAAAPGPAAKPAPEAK